MEPKNLLELIIYFIDAFNPQSAHCFLIVLKKCRQFRCIGLLCSSKLVHSDGKKLACFMSNLVQNLMNLVFSSKDNRKWPKHG